MVFRKKKPIEDKVEARFQQAVGLIKDLDKREFKRFIEGIQLTWEGYDRIRRVQTTEEKETAPIAELEKEMDYKEQ